MSCIRTQHAYWSTCTCEPCTIDRRRKVKHRRIYGYTRPPSDAAWDRIDKWLEQGFTACWIASAAGLAERNIETALNDLRTQGRRRAFGASVTRAILAADIWDATSGRCDATGTRRRLQALAVNGWDSGALAERTGVSFVSLCAIRRGAIQAINPATRKAIAEAFDELEVTPGPSSQARTRALNLGWLPPLAWDDIDDPDERPATRIKGRRDVLAEYVHLTSLGESHEQAIKALGVTDKAIEKAQTRARKDVA